MNKLAIQHFAYDAFCYPLNNDELEISVITGKDVSRVFLIWGDPFDTDKIVGERKWKTCEVEITNFRELQLHFRWTIQIVPPAKRACYYFKFIGDNGEIVYLLEPGIFTEKEFKSINPRNTAFIFPWMNMLDTFETPEWAKKAVFYQIFPSRFARGKCDFIPENIKEWGKLGETVHYLDVFGGNLQGIIDKLDYLQELGITAIYTTPLNKSLSQHKYDTIDYLTVDESFGSNETLKELVQKAHEHGIRIILDAVFNHCGWFFPQWQDVLKNREKSKYASWFMVNDFNFTVEDDWHKWHNARDNKFFTFAYADGMPKLNTNNYEVQDFLINCAKTWVQEYDIDGLRLDVANEVSHDFIQNLRREMYALKKDFYMVGEIWHNSQAFLRGKEFDSVMNYLLQNEILDFCKGTKQTAKEFEWGINRCYSLYYKQVNSVLFNQVDSHDTMRMTTRFGNNKDLSKIALAMLFSLPGTVCIYYGTEIFMEGGDDPDNRRCMPWKEIESGMFDEDLSFTKKIIELRKTYPALRSNRIQFIYEDDENIKTKNSKSRLIHYRKTCPYQKTAMHIVLNGNKKNAKLPKGKVLLSNNQKGNELLPNGMAILEEEYNPADNKDNKCCC